MEENNCFFVSSRGLLKACDIHSSFPVSSIHQLYQYDWSNLREGCTIYICNSAILAFSVIVDQLPCKIILVSGDCDECCPIEVFPTKKDFEDFVENERIIHWFSQNLIIQHPKMTKIPIGLDYHSMTISEIWGEMISPLEQEKQLLNIRNTALPFSERIPKIYSNFHFSINTKFAKDRIDAISQISADLVYYEPSKLERYDTWKKQMKYVFVASPHGNGLDCHRTWEALCLGCIAIVKTSPLDDLYDGLPVLIVEEWSCITEAVLLETIEKCRNMGFYYEKLSLNYWMDKIRDYNVL